MKKRILLFGMTGAALFLVLAVYFFPPGRFSSIRQAFERDRAQNAPLLQMLWKTGERIWWGHNTLGTLEVGDPAPDVRFLTPDGKSEARLSQLLTDKPLVLILGSYT